MKTQNKIIVGCIVLMLGFHASCSRILNSERNKAKLIQNEEVRITTEQSELIYGNRLIELTDSSSKFFSIEIYPLDTFTFSVNDGFRGMASKIEVQGIMHEGKKFSDSIRFSTERDQTIQYGSEYKIREKGIRASKEVKSPRSYWLVVLFLIGIYNSCLWFFPNSQTLQKYNLVIYSV